jgi:hypothetical protein
MSNEAVKLAFSPSSPAPDLKIPKKESSFLRTPDAANPLICKILGNPLRSGEIYYELELHRHSIGNDPARDRRYHVSRRMFNEPSPEVDAYWEAFRKAKALKEAGKEDSEEYRVANRLKETFATVKRYLILVVQPGESKPKILEINAKGKKRLFGSEAYGRELATTGLVELMRSKGRDPINPVSDKGWIKIWRTGMGVDTEWHVEEARVEGTDANGEEVVKPLTAKVGDGLFKLELKDLVNIEAAYMTEDRVWTAEECQAFVDSFGNTIPDRCRRKNNNRYSSQETKFEKRASSVDADPNASGALFNAKELESLGFDLDDHE